VLPRGAGAGTAPAQGAVLDLTLGTLRDYGRVHALVGALARGARPQPEVEALLWCALHAQRSGRYAPHTVVDQAVRACELIGRSQAKPYVNAILRNDLRHRTAIEPRVAADPEGRWRHPQWWIERVQRQHPGHWESILEAGNAHPPMCLRVNRRRETVATYLRRLAEGGIAARPLGGEAVLLERPLPTSRLPGFAEGDVSVQDYGAQRAAGLLDLTDGQRVLDACASPGGKAAHVLERAAVALTALELHAARARVVGENLKRLDLPAEVRVADCSRPESWWTGPAFDRVLADLPCTASGVVRRHPDVKWLRRETDVASCAARQARMLAALWRVLAPGGKLLYVTCSVFAEENEAVVERVLRWTPDAHRLPLPDGGASTFLPCAEHDGFFFALLAKAC